MERRFHVFVRRCPGAGFHVEVLGRAELGTFAEDVDVARGDLARVLARLLARDPEFDRSVPPLSEVRVRRVDVVLRAMQGERLLPVPMRFTAVLHAPPDDDERARADGSAPVVVRIPRLNVRYTLAHEADADAFVEEVVRQRLFMADAAKLLAYAYEGEETVESLTVSYREQHPKVDPTTAPPASRAHESALREACRDLVAEARSGAIERAFSREESLDALIASVCGRRRASAVLIGPSGAGKTALVHELAHRIADAEEGATLRGMDLWATAGGRLVAGMRYLGEWQARLQRILEALRTRRAVLHIEDLSELFASARGDGAMDIPAFLLPSIEAGELVVVCEATAEDLARAERTHPGFVRALRPLFVPALEGRPARSALESVASRIAKGKRARFTEDALVRTADLCERFGDGTALPGAGIALLRAAVTGVTGGERPAANDTGAPRTLGVEEVTRAFCQRTGYPRALVDPAVRLDPDEVLAQLRARVMGQDGALALLRDLVVTLKTGMSDPSRPLGSFLFLGPTGVGKTESALSLAAYLFGDERRVARFDMSEFAAPGSAQRLVSDSPGAQGSLTRRVREQPFGVVLLDEVEKADPGVHDLLLQILGEGRLTDGTGRTVSFRNTVVVLTSNLGADTVNRSLGFGSATRDLAGHYVSAAAQFFRPELLNRIDHIVPFAALEDETVLAITRRAVQSALAREGLGRRGVKVRFDDAVVSTLAKLGYDRRYGARPLKRAIEQWVITPIARLLAARGSSSPTEVELVLRGSGVAVAPTSTPEVSAMLAADVRAEIARRARRSPAARACVLVVEPVDQGAGSRARWLAERYAAWCEGHGATVTIESASRLRVEGEIASALAYEQGVHEFEAGPAIARVRVRVERSHDDAAVSEQPPAGVRLYTAIPEPAVWDVGTEFEWVGPWERAVEAEALDRFVLARMANGAAIPAVNAS
jgi:ATP-dependent Clp protease ATP-binding subunit ClpC